MVSSYLHIFVQPVQLVIKGLNILNMQICAQQEQIYQFQMHWAKSWQLSRQNGIIRPLFLLIQVSPPTKGLKTDKNAIKTSGNTFINTETTGDWFQNKLVRHQQKEKLNHGTMYYLAQCSIQHNVYSSEMGLKQLRYVHGVSDQHQQKHILVLLKQVAKFFIFL